MSFCPTVNLPGHFNARERFLRHIPSGYAPQSLEVLKQVVGAIGSHWPEKGAENNCTNGEGVMTGRKNAVYNEHCDLEKKKSYDATPRNHFETQRCDLMPQHHPEILITMNLDTQWNELYITSVHNALEYLFSIGFRYSEKDHVMVFDTSSHLKELAESKNNDEPLPCYLDFDAALLIKEIDDAICWHRRRVQLLTKKVASSEGLNVIRGLPKAHEPTAKELAMDEDLKCAIDIPVVSLLEDRLSIIKDDRNKDDLKYEMDKTKAFIKRAQAWHDKMANY